MAFIEGGPRPNLGSELGSTVKDWVHQLSQMKMQDVAQRYQQDRLSKVYSQLPGMKPEWAQILAATPEKERAALFRVLPMLEHMGTGNVEGSRQGAESQPGGASDLQQRILGGMEQPGIGQGQAASQFGAPTSPAEAYARAFEPPQMGLEREKMAISGAQHEEKMEETRRPFISGAVKNIQSNRRQLESYENMKRLIKTGQLDDPMKIAFFNMVGLENYPALLKPGSQEYNAEMLNFTSKIKEDFGARPTQWDAQQIFNRMATLMHTNEGKLRIIDANEKKLKAKNAFEQARLNIIKEHKGKIPSDIDLLADERSQKKISKLYNSYKNVLGIGSQTFEELPNAAEYTGKKIVDEATGKTLISDGINWKEI
jgi:hypothetical protein